MVEPYSLNGAQAITLGFAALLVVIAGRVLVAKTRHRTLGFTIVAGGLLSLLGEQQTLSYVFGAVCPDSGFCELLCHVGWFITGFSSVLLAAQHSMPNHRHSHS